MVSTLWLEILGAYKLWLQDSHQLLSLLKKILHNQFFNSMIWHSYLYVESEVHIPYDDIAPNMTWVYKDAFIVYNRQRLNIWLVVQSSTCPYLFFDINVDSIIDWYHAYANPMLVYTSVDMVFRSRGVHCTKHVRVYVSAQKGY